MDIDGLLLRLRRCHGYFCCFDEKGGRLFLSKPENEQALERAYLSQSAVSI